MNEMNLLSEFRAEVPCAEVPPRAEQRLYSALQSADSARGSRPGMRALCSSWHGLARPGGSWRRARMGLLAVSAAGVAAAVTLTLLPGSAAHSRATLSVQLLADKAATAALSQPAIPPGEWLYRQYRTKVGAQSKGSKPHLTGTESLWTANEAASSSSALGLAQGYKIMTDTNGGNIAYYNGQGPAMIMLTAIPYATLASLPSDPAALEKNIADAEWDPHAKRDGGRLSAMETFEEITAILFAYAETPKLAAELFRALAYVPGISVNSDATDSAGRHGEAFTLTNPPAKGANPNTPNTFEIVLNPASYTLMGWQSMWANTYMPAVFTRNYYFQAALISQAYVAKVGDQP